MTESDYITSTDGVEALAMDNAGVNVDVYGQAYEGDEEQDVVLLAMVQGYDWKNALQRIQDYPNECKATSFRGRTALHVACAAPFVPVEIIQALIQNYPEACLQVGTSGMNPLHIACSSDHASPAVVEALLRGSAKANYLTEAMCSMEDVDQDTPLHSACRCGASIEVLKLLLLVYPYAVYHRDYEGLTPLLRLWVREYVLLGGDIVNGVQSSEDLVGELGVAWEKTMLLLYCVTGTDRPYVVRVLGRQTDRLALQDTSSRGLLSLPVCSAPHKLVSQLVLSCTLHGNLPGHSNVESSR